MNEFCTNAGWFGLFAMAILVFLLGFLCGYKPRALFLLEEIEAKYKKEPWEIWLDTKKNVCKSEHSTYGRSTDIHIGEAACEICGERTTIMKIDTSDGEYNLFNCCKPCFEKLWEKNT